MSRLGSHQTISSRHLRDLKALPTDTERVNYVESVLYEIYDTSEGTDYDKAWSLLHSALQMSNPCSDYLDRMRSGPASWAIMGAEDIALTEECLITFLGRFRVWRTARFLEAISAEDIRLRLTRLIVSFECERLSRDDADYAAAWFPRLQDFYRRAAGRFEHVVFVGDLV